MALVCKTCQEPAKLTFNHKYRWKEAYCIECNASERNSQNGRHWKTFEEENCTPNTGKSSPTGRASQDPITGIFQRTYYQQLLWNSINSRIHPTSWDIDFPQLPEIPTSEPEIGPITAWRVWKVIFNWQDSTFQLQSCFVNTIWTPDKPMTGELGANYHSHGSGVHAWKDPQGAFSYLPTIINPDSFTTGWDGCLAIGSVSLWGTVIEHERGYRAEMAKVHSIESLYSTMGPVHESILPILRSAYHV